VNIFVLDTDPTACARAHFDKHVVKMPTESAQILSTALHLHGVEDSCLYRPSHAAHPCTRWAAATRSNFAWLAELGFALVEEHGRRYAHTVAGRRGHAAGEVILTALDHLDRLPDGPLTAHAQAMPIELRQPGDPVAAYRDLYRTGKRHLAQWRSPAAPPAWWS
jgi:hypothetical protein